MVIFAVASQDLNFLMQLFCSVAPLYSTITVPRHVLAESPRFLSPLLGIGAPFEWIYDFPNIAVALLFGIAGACLLAGVPFFREKVLRIRVPSAHSEATDKALAVVISFTGLVLAFSLVQANGNLRNLETQVATEAHNIDQMDRLILRYGDSAISALRGPLRDYANSVVRDEWPELLHLR
jgi:hypothetical protein